MIKFLYHYPYKNAHLIFFCKKSINTQKILVKYTLYAYHYLKNKKIKIYLAEYQTVNFIKLNAYTRTPCYVLNYNTSFVSYYQNEKIIQHIEMLESMIH